MKKLILTTFASILIDFMNEHIFGSPYSAIPEVRPPTCWCKEHSRVIHLYIVYSCFHTIIEELSHCNRNHLA